MSEQLDRTQLKSGSDGVKNTVRSELAVTDENAYPEEWVNSYGYENYAEEGYPEDCEEGFEVCKNKRVKVRIFK